MQFSVKFFFYLCCVFLSLDSNTRFYPFSGPSPILAWIPHFRHSPGIPPFRHLLEFYPFRYSLGFHIFDTCSNSTLSGTCPDSIFSALARILPFLVLTRIPPFCHSPGFYPFWYLPGFHIYGTRSDSTLSRYSPRPFSSTRPDFTLPALVWILLSLAHD